HLKLSVGDGREVSDTKQLRFGIREITYELSLLDEAGHLRRVDYSPAKAYSSGEPAVDVTHQGMREIPAADPFPPNLPQDWKENWHSWVASLSPDWEKSPAIHLIDNNQGAPYLTVKVNGVRIV